MPIAALPIPDGKDIQTFFRNQNVKIGPNPAYIVRMCRGDCTKILHILCSGMLIKIRFRILGCFPLKVQRKNLQFCDFSQISSQCNFNCLYWSACLSSLCIEKIHFISQTSFIRLQFVGCLTCPYMLWLSQFCCIAAPTTWNSLPLHIRNSSSLFGFRRQLKTFLYKLAFDPFQRPTHPPQSLRFGGFPPTLRAL